MLYSLGPLFYKAFALSCSSCSHTLRYVFQLWNVKINKSVTERGIVQIVRWRIWLRYIASKANCSKQLNEHNSVNKSYKKLLQYITDLPVSNGRSKSPTVRIDCWKNKMLLTSEKKHHWKSGRRSAHICRPKQRKLNNLEQCNTIIRNKLREERRG